VSVTIKHIARAANVSHTTVSRALNDSPLIRPETKARIRAIAESLGYSPNISAKSLVLDRSYNIGLFFSTIRVGTTSTFLHDAVRGAGSVVADPYNLVVRGIDDCRGSVFPLSRKRFDGLLVMSQSEEDDDFVRSAHDAGIPVVVLNRKTSVPGVASISSDDRGGVRRLTDYLIGCGHVRIASIEGKPGFKSTEERREGFLEAFRRRGLSEPPEEYRQPGSYDIESGYAAMKRLLELRPRPTAVFCFNDEMAVGALKAIREAGLEVPRDLSVAGFDDAAIAAYLTPALTTVRRPIERISREGAELLMRLVNGRRSEEARAVVVDAELVVRESVCPPPARPLSES